MKKDYMDNGDKLFVDNITIKIKVEMMAFDVYMDLTMKQWKLQNIVY